MAVTLRDVAKRAGVSAMTVSRVVNGSAGVDPDTQRRVEDSILALDYVPNRLARGLVSHNTRTIGLIVPDVVNPFFAPVVRGAETDRAQGRLPGAAVQQRGRSAPRARIC